MSNIAKQPIKIDAGVTVTITDGRIVVNGPKGSLSTALIQGIDVIIADGNVNVKRVSDDVSIEKFAGLTRALTANMIEGVVKGFEKKLELTGVGYRARVDGTDLVLNVGFALPAIVKPKLGTAISVAENVITVSGIDKNLVGDVASDIRRVRPPDPYKGKGIRYMGEKLRKKVGKAAKAAGSK